MSAKIAITTDSSAQIAITVSASMVSPPFRGAARVAKHRVSTIPAVREGGFFVAEISAPSYTPPTIRAKEVIRVEAGDIIALVIAGISLFVAISGGKRTSDHDVADHAHWQGRMEEKLDNIAQNTTHMRDDIKGLTVKFDALSHRVTSVEHKVEAHDKQIDGIWDQMRNDAAQGLGPPPSKEDD